MKFPRKDDCGMWIFLNVKHLWVFFYPKSAPGFIWFRRIQDRGCKASPRFWVLDLWRFRFTFRAGHKFWEPEEVKKNAKGQ